MKMTHADFVQKLSELLTEASKAQIPFDSIVTTLEVTKFMVVSNQMAFQQRQVMQKNMQDRPRIIAPLHREDPPNEPAAPPKE